MNEMHVCKHQKEQQKKVWKHGLHWEGKGTLPQAVFSLVALKNMLLMSRWKGLHSEKVTAQMISQLKTATLTQGRWQLGCCIWYTTFFFSVCSKEEQTMKTYINCVSTNEEKHTIGINVIKDLWKQKSAGFSGVIYGDSYRLQKNCPETFLSPPVKKRDENLVACFSYCT